MRKTKKSQIFTIIILFTIILASDNFVNKELHIEILENDEEIFKQDITSIPKNNQGVVETVNLIPSGIGSSNFYHSPTGDALWTYPTSQTYLDAYWGADLMGYTEQTWNPENKYLQDSITEVAGSTDFDQWEGGVGSVRLDAARRDHIFTLNDTNAEYSLSDIGGTPDPTGGYSSSYDSRSSGEWGEPIVSNDHYPGNREGSSGIDYLQSNPTSFEEGNWPYGNSKNTPSRELSSINQVTQSYSVIAKRYTWYELYYNSQETFDKISASWNTNFEYQSEFRLYFEYDNTSSSTNAYYGADITLIPIGLTEQGNVFDVDISGTIQYDIYQNGTIPSKINVASQTKTFEDSEIDGSFSNDASVSVDQSDNFGVELNSGMHYLRILVNITHHMNGSYNEIGSGWVSQYFSEDIGVEIQISSPYVSISESTPINPLSIWGSKKIDDGNYETEETNDIVHDNSISVTSTTWNPVGEDGSFSHTLGYGTGDERLVVAFVSFEDALSPTNVSTVSYDGQEMLRLIDNVVYSSISCSISMWYLLDSNLPNSGGSYTVAVNMLGVPSGEVMVGVSSYAGVQQMSPFDVVTNTGTDSSTISTSISTETANSLIISAVGTGDAGTASHSGTGAVVRWSEIASSSNSAGGDIPILLPGSSNTDQYTYGVAQNRLTMISSSWSPHIPESIAPETTFTYMGGSSPNIKNMSIESVHVHCSNATKISIGIWTGGTLTDPTGATLLISKINYEISQGWNEISLDSTLWLEDTLTWIGFTTNGSGAVSFTENGSFTNFADVSGAWNQSSPDPADPTDPMDNAIGAGSFIPYYYAAYIEYDLGYVNQSITLIESDWITWDEEQYIPAENIVNLTFGYQIPDSLRGFDGESGGLEYARIVANLTIEKSNQIYNFSQVSSKTFAEVRLFDVSYGIGCDKFYWNVSNEIKSVLNFSTQLKWHIGIVFDSRFELSYNYSVASQVYFNNINCTIETERPIFGTFNIQDLEGNPENAVNISIFKENDHSIFYSLETTSGTAVFRNLSLGEWRVQINKTIIDTGKTVVIYNSTRMVGIAEDFTEDILCNLTSIIFTVQNYLGNPMTAGSIVIQNTLSPSDLYSQTIGTNGEVFFQEIYNGNWRVLVRSASENVIMNFTKSINSIGPTIPDAEKYLISDSSYTTIQANLTNMELHIFDSLNQPAQNLHVSLRNQADNSIIFENYTNIEGNTTISGIQAGNWQLIIYSVNNYIIYNQSDFQINLIADIQFNSIMYNLTNLEIQLTDYSGSLLGNEFSPVVKLENMDDGYLIQTSAVDGFVTFLEVYNGSTSYSWLLTVDITYSGNLYTIFNSSFNIATNGDLISNEVQANRTYLKLTLYDRDNVIIPDALVNLTDSNNPSISYEQNSDSEGKVYLSESYSSNWILTVNYTISGIDSFLATTYTIYQDNNFDFTLLGTSFITTEDVFNCNLTTLDIYVLNHNTERQYAGLYHANITLRNFLRNENITTLLTDPNGFTSLRLPSDTYNFSVVYQGINHDFHFNDTNDLVNRIIHNKTITYSSITEINITLLDPQTKLSILDASFGNTGISGWDTSNGEYVGQEFDLTTFPYYLNLYRNDSVEFEIFFEDIINHLPLTPTVTGSWNLTKNGVYANSSSNLDSLHIESGKYNLTLFAKHYQAGTYALNLEFGQFGYITAYYTIIINILNHTTTLDRLYPLGLINSQWNKDLILQVNFTSVLPESDINITNADVFYSIPGTIYIDKPMTTPGGIYTNSGIYELNVSKWSLDVGVYSMVITASKDNFLTKSITIVFTIVEVDTKSEFYITDEFRVTSSYIKVAYGENITVFANFSYNIPSENNYSVLYNAEYNAYMDNPTKILNLYNNMGLWQFNCTNLATLFSIGVHSLFIVATGDNHEIQIIEITVEIVDFWDTNLEIIQNPSITPWSNNATFILEYSSIETPRNGLLLENAGITKLSITYFEEGEEFLLLTLESTNYENWRWEDLGSGRYQIWLNTSIIEVINTKDFYISCYINYTIYAEKSISPVLWVSPLEVTFNLQSNGEPTTLINLYVDDSTIIYAQLNVSESSSLHNGKPVDGAYVYYEVYNISNSELVELGDFSFIQDGMYTLNLYASKIGNFTIRIYMELINYTITEVASFTLRVSVVQADYSISIPDDFKISEFSLKVAQGENISFYVIYLENLVEYPDLAVTIGGQALAIFDQGGGIYMCNHPAIGFEPLEYTIKIVSNQQYAYPLEKELELEVLEFWDTSLIVDPFDFEIVPWGNLTRFSMTYGCSEAPRDNWRIESATIDRLYISNNEHEIIYTLTSLDRGIYWNWTDLTEGEYEIWINTTFLEISDLEAFFVTPSIYFSNFKPNTANGVISVRPVETTINLFTEDAILPPSIEIGLNENKSIIAILNITDSESYMYGLPINNALISFVVYNSSDESEIFNSGLLFHQSNGVYQFNLSTTVQGEFKIVLYLTYSNYTLTSTPTFLFDTGLDFTILTTNIEPEYKISTNSLKVAFGENITFTILLPNQTIATEYIIAKIGEIELNIFDLGSGEFLVNHQADNFPVGLYEIVITGKQGSYKETIISLQLEILDFWNTKLELLVPPVIYPWNNISTFKVRYMCDEFPRKNEVLENAAIRNVSLSQEIQGSLKTIYILDQSNVGLIWGWSHLGAGEYNIWFNTSIISVDNQSVVYATPYLYFDVYREASVEPYVWIRPVETRLTVFTSAFLDKRLEDVNLYLDQSYELYTFLNISDISSSLYSLSLEGAMIYYAIYQKLNDNSQIFYIGGILDSITTGVHKLTLNAINLGNYVVKLSSVLENFTNAIFNFDFTVHEKPISLVDHARIINTTISTPQNIEVLFKLEIWDSVHDVPLRDAIVEINFGGTIFQFSGDELGSYEIKFSPTILKTYEIGTYNLEIQILKTNYTFDPIYISFAVSLPVDQYLHIPYLYWIIVGGTAVLVTSIAVANQMIKRANIPLFLRQLRKTKKLIIKEKEIGDPILTISRNDEYYEKYHHLWSELDLDLKEIMGDK